MNVMDHIKIIIYLLSLYFIFGLASEDDINYCNSISKCGYTVPSGDIIIEYGKPLNITCTLLPNSSTDTKLYFKTNDRELRPNNQYDVLDETAPRVTYLNEESINLYIKKPKKMKNYFYCICNHNGSTKLACLNAVVVGVKPQRIDDFKCRSNYWTSMTCSWTPPENYVVTDYKVSYWFPDYKENKFYNISLSYDSSDAHQQKTMNFTLEPRSSPMYRQAQELYKFIIVMNNTFGTYSQNYTWEHFKYIYMPPPEGLTGVSKSPSEIALSWNLSTPFVALPKKLVIRVIYKCETYCNSWVLAEEYTTGAKTELSYTLRNLTYAHELYDIRVSMKVDNAYDETWSPNRSVVLRTGSKIPSSAPRTTLGAFQFVDSNPSFIYVYFQRIKPEEENGENFTYDMKSDPPLNLTELTNAYAKFVGAETGKQYIMTIWSKNKIGRSLDSSTAIIPSKRIKGPNDLFRIEHTNTNYQLEWRFGANVRNISHITNYTIFWCEHPSEWHQCKGFLNWIIVPRDLTNYNITLPPTNKTYQFAISANSIDGSSGMLWATCTILANKEVSKLNEVIFKNITSNSIELSWTQRCSDLNSQVIGYVIYYCETNDTYKDNCIHELKNITVDGNLSVHSGTVRNLEPYRTYLFAVSVKTKTTIGARSDFVRNITLEAAPSTPPLDITLEETTNSSITLHWKPPSAKNGRIRHYVIHYNRNSKEIGGDLEKYTLRDLESFMKYNISMQACTSACSERSKENEIVTKMGTPSKPGRPYLSESNDNLIKIEWTRPEFPRGEIQYYQIQTIFDNNKSEILNGTYEETFSFDICRPSSKYNNNILHIRVRAVNIIGNEHFPGAWSDEYRTTSCYQFSWYIFYIVFGIIGLIIMGYGMRWLYGRFRVMRDVEVKLPAGLAPSLEHPEKNIVEIKRYRPDEELLLEKIAEKCATVDSSGCSSAPESITSSEESGTHISIDSGTDQPRTVTDEQKENSLRQRNVTAKGYVLHDATPTVNRGTKPTPAAPGNYCVLGVDPSPKAVQDTPYVTLSDGDSAPSPFSLKDKVPNVSTTYPDLFKTPNPGYVPFANPEPASKNPGYVVAGDLTSPSVDTSDYLLVDTPIVGIKPATVWQQPPIEPSTKPGYVSVGDAPPPVAIKETIKGYVPHRQVEAKSLKKD